MVRLLEESIRLAKEHKLPVQNPKEDALGRRLRKLDPVMPTALDDPDEIGLRADDDAENW